MPIQMGLLWSLGIEKVARLTSRELHFHLFLLVEFIIRRGESILQAEHVPVGMQDMPRRNATGTLARLQHQK